MSTINSDYGLYSPEDAEIVAAQLQAFDEEGWTYKVCHDPACTGQSYIEAYDEDGLFVARMMKLRVSKDFMLAMPEALVYKGETVGFRAILTKAQWESLQRDAQRILGNFPVRNTNHAYLSAPPEGDPAREWADHIQAQAWPVVEIWINGPVIVSLVSLAAFPGREKQFENLKKVCGLLDTCPAAARRLVPPTSFLQ